MDIFPVILKAALAFGATNIDDIFLLALWFSEPSRSFARSSIVAGQYLGFSGLVGISLLGLLGSLVIPPAWIGLLGLLPIGIGLHRLHTALQERKSAGQQETELAQPVPVIDNPSRSVVWQVAAITFANGGDNIGIYTPLFASSGFPQVVIILAVFFVLVAVWCGLGYWLTQQQFVGDVLSRYSHRIVPFVLIGLGIIILLESKAYQLFIPR